MCECKDNKLFINTYCDEGYYYDFTIGEIHKKNKHGQFFRVCRVCESNPSCKEILSNIPLNQCREICESILDCYFQGIYEGKKAKVKEFKNMLEIKD